MRRYFVLLLAILLLLCSCAVPSVPPESGETPTDAPTAQAGALALPGDGVIRDRAGNPITLQALGRDISFYTIGQVQYWQVRLPGVGKYGEPSLFLLTDNAALQAFAAHYNPDDEQTTWFDKIKSIATNLGYATDMKAYKANPDAFPGTVADVSTILRQAITGKTNSPDLYTVMQILGYDRTVARIQAVIDTL